MNPSLYLHSFLSYHIPTPGANNTEPDFCRNQFLFALS